MGYFSFKLTVPVLLPLQSVAFLFIVFQSILGLKTPSETELRESAVVHKCLL